MKLPVLLIDKGDQKKITNLTFKSQNQLYLAYECSEDPKSFAPVSLLASGGHDETTLRTVRNFISEKKGS